MSDLLIPDLDPEMQRRLEGRARASDRDVVEEARAILQSNLGLSEVDRGVDEARPPGMGLGTWLFSRVPPQYRVDLDFNIQDVPSDPPDFT
jgi:plasmid stability protein